MSDAATDPTASAPWSHHSLAGDWRYRPDNPQFAFGDHLGWADSDLDDGDWRTMPIPACWDLADPALHGYEGYVWFRRRFRAPDVGDRAVVLRFEAANYRADAWLNGAYLGAHEGGFTPFSFPVDQHLRPAGDNLLAVRVDNRPLPERIPGARLSWFNYGGLYREVFLEARPRVRIEDAWLDPRPLATGRHGPARIAAEVVLANDRAEAFSGDLSVVVAGRTWTTPATVPAGESLTLRGGLDLADVPYWSPAQPSLLPTEVVLRGAAGAVDQRIVEIGVRRLTVDADGPRLRLNGETVRLAGFNRHEDYPTTGRAHDETILWQDLRAIKAMGGNFVRASHYPQHPRFYDACDRLGLMVMDEIPLWGWGRGLADDGGTAPLVAAEAQLEEMIRRDRNRACVVIWSVSNETGGGRPEVDDGNIALIRRARDLDPSRLVTHVALHSVWAKGLDRALDEDDLLCLNEYEGSLQVDPAVRRIADLDAVKVTLGRQLAGLHERFAEKPMLITEYGGIGLPGHHGDFPWSEEFYAATIRAHWEAFAAKPWVVGALLWCWQDYPLHPSRPRWYPLGHYGVVGADRRPKAAARTMAELFAGS